MERFTIEGGVALSGSVRVSGSKNAVLALMACSLLTEDRMAFANAPRLRDVETMIKILEGLGVRAGWESGDEVCVESGEPARIDAPYDLVRTMRASFMVLGPLLARCGHARVSLPGGCAIGTRPVDQHIKGLAALGAKIELSNGYVEARAPRLRGASFAFDLSTVNGTQNVLMAACLADGTSVLENAAVEPEVGELVAVLQAMGAQIEGAGTRTLTVRGVSRLSGVRHFVSGDRIEAGTLLAAAGITGGEVDVTGVDPSDLTAQLDEFRRAGFQIGVEEGRISIAPGAELRPLNLETAIHPGLPTDMQAQMMALLTQAQGRSQIGERIFENRFMHVPELVRMNADIHIDGATAIIEGPRRLSGASVMATDLRASACLVLAGLAASGETRVRRVYHIDRGYERIEQKLQSLGARIRREQE